MFNFQVVQDQVVNVLVDFYLYVYDMSIIIYSRLLYWFPSWYTPSRFSFIQNDEILAYVFLWSLFRGFCCNVYFWN